MAGITYQKILKMEPEDFGKMTRNQIASLVADMRSKLQKRQKQFEKAGKYVYSPAIEKIEEYYDGGKRSISKQTRNQLLEEAFRLQSFFKSYTATVKGARKVMRDQDIRIFGKKESGAPRYKMTNEQRVKFWKFYDEFLNQRKDAYYRFKSSAIQQYLGEFIERKNLEITPEMIDKIYEDLDKREKDDNNGITSSNVFSTRWGS